MNSLGDSEFAREREEVLLLLAAAGDGDPNPGELGCSAQERRVVLHGIEVAHGDQEGTVRRHAQRSSRRVTRFRGEDVR